MSSLKLAKSYLRQASARLKDARDALTSRNFPYAVRLSQECAELSLKASLRVVGIDYPKVHDVSPGLEKVRDRFPVWFSSELDFLKETSVLLAAKRGPSLYGGETEMLGPDEVMGREDAADALRRAERTYELCRRLAESKPLK